MHHQNRTCPLAQQQLIAEYFLEIRAKILDIAAFLDRLDRSVDHNAQDDFRLTAMRKALQTLSTEPLQPNTIHPNRIYAIQMIFSDPTTEPLAQLDRKSALGAPERNGTTLNLHTHDDAALDPHTRRGVALCPPVGGEAHI